MDTARPSAKGLSHSVRWWKLNWLTPIDGGLSEGHRFGYSHALHGVAPKSRAAPITCSGHLTRQRRCSRVLRDT